MLPKVSSGVLTLFSFSTSHINCPLSFCLFFLQMSSPHSGPPATLLPPFPWLHYPKEQFTLPTPCTLWLALGLSSHPPVGQLSCLTVCFGCPDPSGWTACLSCIMPWTAPCREQVTVNVSQIPGVKRRSGAWEMAEPGLLGKFLCNAALFNTVTTHY